jgi:hypothetical protein
MNQCNSCGAEIIWMTSAAGRTIPLSAASREMRLVVVGDNQVRMMATYLSHFADCPNAELHRKKKKDHPGERS